MKFPISIIFILITSLSIAQLNLSDTFKMSMSANVSDSLKIDNLNQAIYKYVTHDPISVLPYSDTAIRLSRKLNDQVRLANSLNRKGLAYFYLGDYNSALNYYFQSLEAREKTGHPFSLWREYNNIGLVLKNQLLHYEALRYFELALSMVDEDDLRTRAIILNNIGICYKGLEEYDLAKTQILEAIAINEKIGEQQSLAHNYNNLGNIHSIKEEYQEAIPFFNKALKINRALFNKFEENQNVNNLAISYIQMLDFEKASQYLNVSHKIVNELNSEPLIADYYYSMQKFYAKSGNYEEAYRYMNLYTAKTQKIDQDARLTQFEQLKNLALAEKELQKVEFLQHINKIQSEKLKIQRNIQILGGLIFLIILASAFFLWRNLKTIKHLNRNLKTNSEKLTELNEELITKNEELQAKQGSLEQALEKVNKTQQQLVHSEKMASLGLLAAGVAHEINNPLNFIQGGNYCIETYLSDNLPEHLLKLQPYIESISEGVVRATRIVSSLNHYSRQTQSEKDDCDIHAIINHCLLMLQNETKHRIEVIKQFAESPMPIKCNEGELHQSILNIILNAIHAIEGKGTITLKTSFAQKIQIQITDTGSGIAPENLPKLFDPFFTTKDPGKGTGLGLSITYNIITKHGGTIDVISNLGVGTTFIINLPLTNSEN